MFTILKHKTNPVFHQLVRLNLCKPIDEQLSRYYIKGTGHSKEEVGNIIELNTSLCVEFGWGFYSSTDFEHIMEDCTKHVHPKYNNYITGHTFTDTSYSWLGFEKQYTFYNDTFRDYDLESLITYNNEISHFQTEVIRYISSHELFLKYSIVHNFQYRYKYFNERKKDPVALSDAFHYYINAVTTPLGIFKVPKHLIEENIGCYYLHHPDVFFELLDFYILRGNIYE